MVMQRPHFRIPALLVLTAVFAVVALPTGSSRLTDGAPLLTLSSTLPQLPLAFEANAGRTDESVAFVARSPGATLFFRAEDVVLSLATIPEPTRRRPGEPLSRAATGQQRTTVHLSFLGVDSAARVVGTDRQPGVVNSLIGNDPDEWRTDIPTYSGVRYQQLYPGIDLHYAGTAGSLKGTYVVAAGADPAQIRWRYVGAKGVDVVRSTGQLRVAQTAPGSVAITEARPVAWQDIDGRRVPVQARYATAADGTIRFAVGEYDRARELIIDPTLAYSSYLGGNSADYGYDIAVDAQRNVYVTGATFSTDFPLANPVQSTPSPYGDLFVTKLNAGGATLAYSTYLGGNDSDVGLGISVDSDGSAYVTGETWSTNFPTRNPIQSTDPGIQQDVIVVKLNPAGNGLVYSTYLGGFNSQTGWDIAVDGTRSVYLTGHTLSPNFPVLNAFQPQQKGIRDAFVTKINPAGSALVYSTYLGSSGDLDYGFSIAVDGSGNAYVTGQTTDDDYPTLNPLQPTNAGFGEAFVTKLNATGKALVYSTYLGGADNEFGKSIAVDSAGNAYLTGDTSSSNFPTANAFQPRKGAFDDAFVTKINSGGSALVYSTYLGGNNRDGDYDANIAVDTAGNAYVAGNTASTDFPTVNAFQSTLRGYDDDAFVAKVNAQGSALLYSTYLGGNNIAAGLGDYAYGLALDSSGNAYVTGHTFSETFPVAGPPFQASNRGNFDAFVAVVNDGAGTPPSADFALAVSPSSQTVRRARSTSYNATVTSLNGFAGGVQLSVSGVPARTDIELSKGLVSVAAGGTASSRLTVRPRNTAPTGSFTLTITATSAGKTHSQPVRLVIRR